MNAPADAPIENQPTPKPWWKEPWKLFVVGCVAFAILIILTSQPEDHTRDWSQAQTRVLTEDLSGDRMTNREIVCSVQYVKKRYTFSEYRQKTDTNSGLMDLAEDLVLNCGR